MEVCTAGKLALLNTLFIPCKHLEQLFSPSDDNFHFKQATRGHLANLCEGEGGLVAQIEKSGRHAANKTAKIVDEVSLLSAFATVD